MDESQSYDSNLGFKWNQLDPLTPTEIQHRGCFYICCITRRTIPERTVWHGWGSEATPMRTRIETALADEGGKGGRERGGGIYLSTSLSRSASLTSARKLLRSWSSSASVDAMEGGRKAVAPGGRRDETRERVAWRERATERGETGVGDGTDGPDFLCSEDTRDMPGRAAGDLLTCTVQPRLGTAMYSPELFGWPKVVWEERGPNPRQKDLNKLPSFHILAKWLCVASGAKKKLIHSWIRWCLTKTK